MSYVAVVNYGMGNIDSVARALQECGGAVCVTDRAEELERATHVVLPGVGAFADGMGRIRQRGLDRLMAEQCLGRGIPLLGLCLGMQLLARRGDEGGETPGLGFIAAEVKRLAPDGPTVRLPHVGWNEVHFTRPSALLAGVADGADFYFTHSYQMVCDQPEVVLATSPYCGGFASVVGCGRIFGVQFHPEKSQKVGFQLLRNFLAS